MEKFDVESRKWDNYINRFKQYLIVNSIDNSLYVSKLISTVGCECYELMENLCKPYRPEEKSFSELVEIVRKNLEPAESVVARRHVFRHRYQQDGEDITKYVNELRLLANACEFGDKFEESIRDQLASGVSRDDIRQLLFAQPNLTYESAVKLSLAMETAQKCSQLRNKGIDKKEYTDKVKKLQNGSVSCWRCGRLPHHDPADCPYQRFQCNICNKIGHLRKMCPEGAQVKSFTRRPRSYSRKETKTRRKPYINVRVNVDK